MSKRQTVQTQLQQQKITFRVQISLELTARFPKTWVGVGFIYFKWTWGVYEVALFIIEHIVCVFGAGKCMEERAIRRG